MNAHGRPQTVEGYLANLDETKAATLRATIATILGQFAGAVRRVVLGRALVPGGLGRLTDACLSLNCPACLGTGKRAQCMGLRMCNRVCLSSVGLQPHRPASGYFLT